MIMRSTVMLIAVVGLFGLSLKPPEHGCPGSNPGLVNLTISYSQGAKVNVAPPMKSAHPGDVLRFNLFGKAGTFVSVDGKASDPDAAWIDGSGNNLKFYVCVPPDVLPEGMNEKDFHYGSIAYGSLPLDPLIRVHRN